MTETIVETLDKAMRASPFIRFAGLRIVAHDGETGRLEMEMPARPAFLRGDGGDDMVHGGPVAALIDTAGDFAVAAIVGGVVPTINIRIDFLRPARGTLRAVAVARRIGRVICLVDIDVFGTDGALCAVGRGTYSGQPK